MGVFIKGLRKQRNYSQEFIASELGIIRQTYSHYETGRIKLSLEIIEKLANLYNCPIADFFIQENQEMYNITKISAKEYDLLTTFRLLDEKDQCDILEFIKIKSR